MREEVRGRRGEEDGRERQAEEDACRVGLGGWVRTWGEREGRGRVWVWMGEGRRGGEGEMRRSALESLAVHPGASSSKGRTVAANDRASERGDSDAVVREKVS